MKDNDKVIIETIQINSNCLRIDCEIKNLL